MTLGIEDDFEQGWGARVEDCKNQRVGECVRCGLLWECAEFIIV